MADKIPPISSDSIPQLLEILKQLQLSLEAFLHTLEIEKEAIRTSDFSKLESNLPEKTKCAESIESHGKNFEKISNIELSSLLTSDSITLVETPLQAPLKSIQTLSTQCHDLNLANGISINMLNNMNNFTLNLLSRRNPNLKTYGSKGLKDAIPVKGRQLGKA